MRKTQQQPHWPLKDPQCSEASCKATLVLGLWCTAGALLEPEITCLLL